MCELNYVTYCDTHTHMQVLCGVQRTHTHAYTCLQICSRANPGLVLICAYLTATFRPPQATGANPRAGAPSGIFVRFPGSALPRKSAATSGLLNYLLSPMVMAHVDAPALAAEAQMGRGSASALHLSTQPPGSNKHQCACAPRTALVKRLPFDANV